MYLLKCIVNRHSAENCRKSTEKQLWKSSITSIDQLLYRQYSGTLPNLEIKVPQFVGWKHKQNDKALLACDVNSV